MANRVRTDEYGMTLIELLVVVLIVGILLAIAVPLYRSHQHKVRETTALEQLKAAVVAIDAEIAAKGGKAPTRQELIPNARYNPPHHPLGNRATAIQKRIDTLWSPTTHAFRYRQISRVQNNKRLDYDDYVICVALVDDTNPKVIKYESTTGRYQELRGRGRYRAGSTFVGTTCP